MRKSSILSASVIAMALASQAAVAQDTNTAGEEKQESKSVLNTITVTATKREQTLQEVPIAVSVVDQTVIEEANIVDLLDLQSVVPSLRASQLERSSNATFIIRGFGNGGNNIGVEPSVAAFIDGVFRTRSSGSLSDMPDVERVEVLRGPQSTLFGKNASAGVISLVTAKPSFEWGGKVEGTYGNYNQIITKGLITGPITDTLAFSLAGSMNKRDGYATNHVTGNTLNDRDRQMIRGQLLWEPTDEISFRFIADHDKMDEICCYAPNFENGPTGAAIALLGGEVPSDPYSYETSLNFDPTSEVENSGYSLQGDWDMGWATLTSITSLRNQQVATNGDVDFTSADILGGNDNQWDIDTFTQEFRLVGGGDKFDWLVGGFYYDEDLDVQSNVTYGTQFRPYALTLAGGQVSPAFAQVIGALELEQGEQFFAPGTGTFETFTQKNESVNLFGQFDYHATDKLTVTAGLGYVQDEKTVTANAFNNDLFSATDFATTFASSPTAAALLPDVMRALDLPTLTDGAVPVPFDSAVFGQLFAGVVGQDATPANIGAWQAAVGGGDATALAQFGQIQALTPGTEVLVAAGLGAAFVEDLQFLPGMVGLPNSIEGNSTDDSKLSYTVRAAYDLMDSVNVYASYGTGYKASSWNITRDSSFTLQDQADLTSAGLIPTNRTAGTRFAGPEDVSIIEIGAKANFERGSINLAIFDQTIEGFQTVLFQGTGFVLANAGEQNAKGLEVDATYKPIDQLTLGVAGLFLDPEFVSFENAPGIGGETVDLSGETPAGIHTTSLSFSALYEDEISPGVEGFIRADYQYEDEIQVIDNIPEAIMSREVNMLNASVGFRFDSGFEATIWGRNITDDQYTQSGFPTAAQAGSFNGYPNAPATYGMTLRKKW